MRSNYYYLVTGLPDILLDDAKMQVSFKELADEISEQVTPSDALLIRDIRTDFDKNNVVAMLADAPFEFDSRGNFDQSELTQELKLPDSLVDFIIVFLESRPDSGATQDEILDESVINKLFYQYMLFHKNSFVANWYSFDLDLRNILAGISARRLGDEKFSIERNVIGDREVAEHVRKSSAHDFSLAAKLPWVDRLVALEKENLLEFEKTVDQLRWEKLNDMTEFTYFQIETLLSFLLKVEMVERWQGLDESEGRKMLDKLLEDLSSGINI